MAVNGKGDGKWQTAEHKVDKRANKAKNKRKSENEDIIKLYVSINPLIMKLLLLLGLANATAVANVAAPHRNKPTQNI